MSFILNSACRCSKRCCINKNGVGFECQHILVVMKSGGCRGGPNVRSTHWTTECHVATIISYFLFWFWGQAPWSFDGPVANIQVVYALMMQYYTLSDLKKNKRVDRQRDPHGKMDILFWTPEEMSSRMPTFLHGVRSIYDNEIVPFLSYRRTTTWCRPGISWQTCYYACSVTAVQVVELI